MGRRHICVGRLGIAGKTGIGCGLRRAAAEPCIPVRADNRVQASRFGRITEPLNEREMMPDTAPKLCFYVGKSKTGFGNPRPDSKICEQRVAEPVGGRRMGWIAV